MFRALVSSAVKPRVLRKSSWLGPLLSRLPAPKSAFEYAHAVIMTWNTRVIVFVHTHASISDCVSVYPCTQTFSLACVSHNADDDVQVVSQRVFKEVSAAVSSFSEGDLTQSDSRRLGKHPAREPAVERAGMDEWYVDITDVVDNITARCHAGVLVGGHIADAIVGRGIAPGVSAGTESAYRDVDGAGVAAAFTPDAFTVHDAPANGDTSAAFFGVVFGSPPPADDHNARRLRVASRVCDEIRRRVRERVGLTTSAGVSTCKLFAKMVASNHKPGGQTVFVPTPDNVALLLPQELPVRAVHGIGRATAARLAEAGVTTIGEVRGMQRWPSSLSDPSSGSSLPPVEQIR